MKTEQSPGASETPETDPEQMSENKKQGWLSRARHAVAVFFVQTFRPRTREDYTELFQRGFKGHKEGVRNKYPWMYVRFLGLCIVLFAIAASVYYLTGNTLGAPQLLFFGAGLGCITFLLLIYELYTGNDMSLLLVLGVCIIGGFISVCLAQLGYLAYIPDGDWAEPFWVGFWEEFCKALVTILVIVVLRKQDPFAAFLIGVAIGSGFALSEDAGYIYVYSAGLLRVTDASMLALERACMAICTHATWTGIIAWAFAKFRNPFINLRFWGCVALCMLMHALWDLPDVGWINIVIKFFLVVGGIWFEAWIIYKCKKPTLAVSPGDTAEVQLSINLETGLIGGKEKDAGYFSRAGNLAGCLCIVGAALLLSIFFAFNPFAARKKTVTYTDVDQFISVAQLGLSIETDPSRPYDDTVPLEDNYSYTVTDGLPDTITQRLPAVINGVESEENYILYTYSFSYSNDDEEDEALDPDEDQNTIDPDEDTDSTNPDDNPDENQESTEPDNNPDENQESTEPEENTDGEEEETEPVTPAYVELCYEGIYYRGRTIGDRLVFILNSDYSSWSVSEDATKVYLTIVDDSPWYEVGGIILLTLAGCAFLGGVIAFAACKAKSRRMKKNAQ
ncbi:MAG: PrsW family glutamic-type intramembrane protease [Clostridia bacterium]|nr:PrsW family glutamic-type intramembrane protease [Clostridia bacterium]